MENNILTIRVEDNQLNVGEKVKFDNGRWLNSTTGAVMSPDRQYLVLGTMVKLVRWMESGPPSVIAAKPGEDLPDVDELNAAIPESSWLPDGYNGKPRPPWARWYIVVFLDVVNAQLFSHGNSTFGMINAFHELQQRVQIMSALQGAEVMPVVQLRDALMKTGFGDKRRPHFLITGWRQFRDGALRLVDHSKSALKEIEPPSLRDELRDDIAF